MWLLHSSLVTKGQRSSSVSPLGREPLLSQLGLFTSQETTPALPTPSSTGCPATLASLSSPWEDSSFVSVVICYLLLLISVLPEKQHRAMAPKGERLSNRLHPIPDLCQYEGGKSRGRETEPGGGATALRGKWPQALGWVCLWSFTAIHRDPDGVVEFWGGLKAPWSPPTMAEVAVFPPIR